MNPSRPTYLKCPSPKCLWSIVLVNQPGAKEYLEAQFNDHKSRTNHFDGVGFDPIWQAFLEAPPTEPA